METLNKSGLQLKWRTDRQWHYVAQRK